MKKADLKLLERVFAAEIENCLPYQPHKKSIHHYERLESDGMVERMTRHFGKPPLVVTVEGWQLTHAGRITYCESC